MCNKYSLSLIFLLMVLAVQAYSKSYSIDEIPDPKAWNTSNHVSNPDGILMQQAVNKINTLCRQLDESVETELCVVAIDAYNNMFWVDAHEFGIKLFNKLGVGKKGKNTGVLVLLVRESREVEIITGGGVEGLLPDITCGHILDENIAYLNNNDFDSGLVGIADGICKHLTTDVAKAELLLGWRAKEFNPAVYIYLTCGFMLLIVLSIIGYKRLQGTEGERRKEIQFKSETIQRISGFLSFIFPLPIWFFYLLYKHLRSKVQDVPMFCEHCKRKMILLNDGKEAFHLSSAQLAEQRVQSKEYAVWQCENCKRVKTTEHNGLLISRFIVCPACGARTFSISNSVTLRRATYSHPGERQDIFRCAHCGHSDVHSVLLPMLQRMITTAPRGFGGGRLSGGLGGGSFGGGMTFGGGAGRRF